MSKLAENEAEFPIFDAVLLKDLFLVAGGGGGQKFGRPNFLGAFSALTLESKRQLDTKEVLYERLHVYKAADAVVALSDNTLTIFEVTPANEIVHRDSAVLFEKPSDSPVSSFLQNNNLLVANAETKSLLVYTILGRALGQPVTIPLDQPVLSFQKSAKNNTVFCIFPTKILAFDTSSKKFVADSFQFLKPLGKALTFASDDSSLLGVIENGPSGATLHLLTPKEKKLETLTSLSSINISKTGVTCCRFLGGFFAAGTVDGQVLVYWLTPDNNFRLVKRVVAHHMPIRALVMKLTANLAASKNNLVLSSFGSDSLMKNFLMEPPSGRSYPLIQIFLAVLFIAFVFNFLLRR